jgi:hypothetical protein
MDTQPTALERALVANTLEMLLILEDLPEDEIALRTATNLMEGIASVVQELDDASRARFVAIALELAVEWDAKPWSSTGQRLRESLADFGLEHPAS